MKNSFLFLLLSLVVALSVLGHAQDKDDDDDDDQIRPMHPPVMKPTEQPAGLSFACPYDKDFQKPHTVGDYTLRILPTIKAKKDKDNKDDQVQDGDPRCRAVLTSSSGKRITIAYEWALSIDPVTGLDINGDGVAELILMRGRDEVSNIEIYELSGGQLRLISSIFREGS